MEAAFVDGNPRLALRRAGPSLLLPECLDCLEA